MPFILLLVFLSACSHKEVKQTAQHKGPLEDVSIEAKQAAAQIGTSYVTEVSFKKGATSLSADQSRKINQAFDEVSKQTSIERISQVVWSDNQATPSEDQDLSDSDQELVNQRSEYLKSLIEAKNSDLKIESINMAQHPGKIKTFLKTEDVRIQQSFQTTQDSMKSKMSKAIVIFLGKNNN